MSTYLWVIQQAVFFFPVIAFVMTIPYMLYNYHKYGSVIASKTFMVYSFVLYMLCAYFLVIMPLPDKSKVALMTGPRAQLVPGMWIQDILKEGTRLHGVYKIIKNRAVFQFGFNVLMTIPFGMFVKYYLQCGWKKTILYSFLLSLFFELTQLSGLYGIYPRSYRLFDVDDLFANTLGGWIGYLIMVPVGTVMPSREELDQRSFTKGSRVSLTKRITALVLDSFFCMFCTIGIEIVLNCIRIQNVSYILVYFCVYVLWNIIRNGLTFGKKFVHMQIVDGTGKDAKWYQFVLRYAFLYGFMKLPGTVYWLFEHVFPNPWDFPLAYRIPIFFVFFMWMIIALVKISFQEPLWYEKLSRTKVISTIIAEAE